MYVSEKRVRLLYTGSLCFVSHEYPGHCLNQAVLMINYSLVYLFKAYSVTQHLSPGHTLLLGAIMNVTVYAVVQGSIFTVSEAHFFHSFTLHLFFSFFIK